MGITYVDENRRRKALYVRFVREEKKDHFGKND